MELLRLTPTSSVTHHGPLTQTQIRPGKKHPIALLLTTHDHHSLIGLPRELRDEILWLAVQDDVGSGRDIELISRPSSTIRALTRVSRSDRAEVADIYWSQTKLHYSTHNLIRNGTHEGHCGRYRFQSWLST